MLTRVMINLINNKHDSVEFFFVFKMYTEPHVLGIPHGTFVDESKQELEKFGLCFCDAHGNCYFAWLPESLELFARLHLIGEALCLKQRCAACGMN